MGTFKFDTDYGSLAAALTAAAGEVLVISANHSITAPHTVPANTHLVGNGGSITITDDDENVLEIGGDGVTIEGIEIIGTGSAPPVPWDIILGNGIYATGRQDLTVKDCVIRGFNSCGILLRGCRDASIRGNRFYGNRGNESQADICVYSSSPTGGRLVIEGNFCLSNNSQGIYVDALGFDDDVAVLGNVCVATDGGGDEIESGLARRHGILVGYASPEPGNGRITILGNICRNSLWTGIYLAAEIELRSGVVIAANVCSLNGLAAGESASVLAGGIYINGGGRGTLVANNAICDFRGDATQLVGCLVVNHTISGATATLSGNVCDTSTADGIVLKGLATGVHVLGNRTHAIARHDVIEIPIDPGEEELVVGGNRIEQNQIVRTNSDFQSVIIHAGESTQTTYVLDNAITGFNKAAEDEGDTNTGVIVVGGVGTKPVEVSGNVIREFRVGIANYGYIQVRYNSLLRFDFNKLVDCVKGIVLASSNGEGAMVVEGNRFNGVTTPVFGTGGGISGYQVGYVGRRDGDRLVLLDRNVAPTDGAWAVGDRAEFTAPTAGGNIGTVCTTAGTPGTWKTYGAIAA
jgi:hypothetical protein